MTNEMARDRQFVYNMFYEAAEGMVLELGDESVNGQGDLSPDLEVIDETIDAIDARYDAGLGCTVGYDQMGLIAAIAMWDAVDHGVAVAKILEDSNPRQDYPYAQN